MKKYLATSLFLLVSVSYAASNSVKLGQKDHHTDSDPCNKPEIIGCGPCHKQCLEQNNLEGAKADTGRNTPTAGKTGKAAATKQ
jgi:hypothetical protein